jgi:hypothetical protein
VLEIPLPISNGTNLSSQSGVCMVVHRQGARLATTLEPEGGLVSEADGGDFEAVFAVSLEGHTWILGADD